MAAISMFLHACLAQSSLLVLLFRNCPFWPCAAYVGGAIGLVVGAAAGYTLGKKSGGG
jgi:hypothetical protein